MKQILFFLLLLSFLALVSVSQTYRVKPRVKIPPMVKSRLDALATNALALGEVPVAAVLVYGDSIIGTGFNTVVRDTLLSGHAEMNAINEAHKKYRASWNTLDRAKMTLYSTYEPCEMCKGAMLHWNIQYAVFEGPKPALDQVKTTVKAWLYEWRKKRFYAPGMQENLFQQHPDYKSPQQ